MLLHPIIPTAKPQPLHGQTAPHSLSLSLLTQASRNPKIFRGKSNSRHKALSGIQAKSVPVYFIPTEFHLGVVRRNVFSPKSELGLSFS